MYIADNKCRIPKAQQEVIDIINGYMKHERTIWELYAELFSNTDKWCYYPNFTLKGFSLDRILDEGNEAVRFIEKYFQCGGKYMIVRDIARYCRPDRATHSISTFFLGILLLPLFKKHHIHIDVPEDKTFLWLWFLTCLYHDMAYKFEEDKNHLPTLNRFVVENNITYQILNDRTIRFKGVTKKTVRAYYRYRINECGCVDHGIAGGILLYNSLRQNYAEVYNYCRGVNNNVSYDNFKWNGLHLSSSHFREYAKCANAIIQHNLWFKAPGQTDFEKYVDYHLDELIYSPSARPYYKDWLTALLVFCDTIEPVKRFLNSTPSSLLKEMILDFDDEGTYLKISFNKSCVNPASYIERVSEMKDWTNLTIQMDEQMIVISNINKMYK